MSDITEGETMQDRIEIFKKSLIQHGKTNNRIYLMKLATEDAPEIISELENLAKKNEYTKIFAKIQADVLPFFISKGYSIEAFIPRFYDHKTDCLLVSKFFDEKRKIIPVLELELFQKLITTTEKNQQLKYKHSLKYIIKKLSASDVVPITEIFGHVFKTYPFPVHNPDYISETMQHDATQYFGVLDGTKLIGVSTAEIDIVNKNSEMTDFAVMPEYRGQNLAFRLLTNMEIAMKANNIKTCYTIARLNEPGMSKTFLKSGYKYSGTLINNTNISGSIESMNVLYKHI